MSLNLSPSLNPNLSPGLNPNLTPNLAVKRIAFFGSPAFALPVLEALRANFEVVLVVAQPSKPAGRGLRLTPPAIAAAALELGLPLEQPAKLRRSQSD